jgi:hypothetical protein
MTEIGSVRDSIIQKRPDEYAEGTFVGSRIAGKYVTEHSIDDTRIATSHIKQNLPGQTSMRLWNLRDSGDWQGWRAVIYGLTAGIDEVMADQAEGQITEEKE